MDSMLVIIGFCCMLIGVIGSFLPVVPGAPMSCRGAPLFYNCDSSKLILSITLVTIITSILEYIIPSRGTNDSEEVPMAFGEQISD
jgi:uncharacterized protein YqgC (DUF456 family)